ncbi:chemotaxis protein CheB [Sphingomonas abietis]|uniref:protein-glutamate methylesterase n=1 Tax=Sphingomonas abietis TaxID=3012344 RepID=A0ABY7NI94_9SPHN|nr:chemotaxis protein CheB [Sphingomonas abietis]WBO20720.1 chemotaxis protein CheB [Sphingomonas abietis]
MADTKVLVVDDSLTMRALISRVLETLPGINVIGTADGAAEAKTEVLRLKPDVMTLDIEMPGMSGIEYLAELMEDRPMPVIMFSTRTEAGAASSIEALRLGAIDCFPKPKAASQAEFDAILCKLGTRIRTAKHAVVKPTKLAAVQSFDWNGRMLTIGMDASGTRKLFELLGSFPVNCPPTLIVAHIAPELIDGLVERLDRHAAAAVVKAGNGMRPAQGTIYLTQPGPTHFGVDQWPGGQIRQLTRDPVSGERPSISILFAAQAKAAATDAVGLMLTEAGEDGVAGLRAIQRVGGHVVAPAHLLGGASADGGYILQGGDAQEPVAWDKVAATILGLCSQ